MKKTAIYVPFFENQNANLDIREVMDEVLHSSRSVTIIIDADHPARAIASLIDKPATGNKVLLNDLISPYDDEANRALDVIELAIVEALADKCDEFAIFVYEDNVSSRMACIVADLLLTPICGAPVKTNYANGFGLRKAVSLRWETSTVGIRDVLSSKLDVRKAEDIVRILNLF